MVNSISATPSWRTVSNVKDTGREEAVCEGLDRLRERSVVIGSSALKEMWEQGFQPDHDAVLLHDCHVVKYEQSGVAAFDRLAFIAK